MAAKELSQARTAGNDEGIGDFERARTVRREAALALSMSERLARMHALCKQMSAIKGAVSAH